VTYSVDIKASNQIDYTVQSASDYYPYGKALRSYGKERYQSTYHERDVESGFDYRGARFYDADVARFNSLDPLAMKYASLSDYNYVMGNPIVIADPDGRDNIIYLIALEGTSKQVDLTSVVAAANEGFKALGVETRVVVFSGNDFDPKFIDKTDGVAVLGISAAQIKDFVRNELNGINTNTSDFKEWTSADGDSPEFTQPKWNDEGGVIAVDVKGGDSMANFAKKTDSSLEEATGFTIVHGAGHITGIVHSEFRDDDKGFMDDGQSIINSLSQKESLNDVYKSSENVKPTEKFIKHFGSNKASRNYEQEKSSNSGSYLIGIDTPVKN